MILATAASADGPATSWGSVRQPPSSASDDACVGCTGCQWLPPHDQLPSSEW